MFKISNYSFIIQFQGNQCPPAKFLFLSWHAQDILCNDENIPALLCKVQDFHSGASPKSVTGKQYLEGVSYNLQSFYRYLVALLFFSSARTFVVENQEVI